jgi:hypothetical protein
MRSSRGSERAMTQVTSASRIQAGGSTRACLAQLLDALHTTASSLECGAELDRARALAEVNGAMVQRHVAAERGIAHVPRSLCERFLHACDG